MRKCTVPYNTWIYIYLYFFHITIKLSKIHLCKYITLSLGILCTTNHTWQEKELALSLPNIDSMQNKHTHTNKQNRKIKRFSWSNMLTKRKVYTAGAQPQVTGMAAQPISSAVSQRDPISWCPGVPLGRARFAAPCYDVWTKGSWLLPPPSLKTLYLFRTWQNLIKLFPCG